MQSVLKNIKKIGQSGVEDLNNNLQQYLLLSEIHKDLSENIDPASVE